MNLGDVLGLGKDLGRRFLLVGLLPSAVLAVLVGALLMAGAPGGRPDLDLLRERVKDLEGWEGALLLIGLLAVAIAVQPLQLSLTRLLEGYGGSRLMSAGRRRQRAKLLTLDEALAPRPVPPSPGEVATLAALAGDRRARFPPSPDDVLGTSLGNVLRAAEANAGKPYGLDAVVIWPRLYAILPDTTRAIVNDQRDSLDQAVRFSAVFSLAALVTTWLLWWEDWWLLVPAVCAALAWTSYRSAVSAALLYGELVRSAVDLHRFDLLEALHLPLPDSPDEERACNEQLSLFLRQDVPMDVTYEHPPPPVLP